MQQSFFQSSSSDIDSVQSVCNDMTQICENQPENIENYAINVSLRNEVSAVSREENKLAIEVKKVENMPMPPLVLFQEAMKDRKLFIFFMDKIIETVAFWIIQHGDIVSAQGHSLYRDRLAEEYPLLKEKCIEVLLICKNKYIFKVV